MITANQTLRDLLPREQVGSRTGELYEYQYQQAARECLTLLDNNISSCVFCEWHDDYVTEAPPPQRYRFYQVKTRKAALGPWTIADIFGIKKKPGPKSKKKPSTPTLDKDSIAARMLEHYTNFSSTCEFVAIVTDNAIRADLEYFLIEIQKLTSPSQLLDNIESTFQDLLAALSTKISGLNESILFDFLKRFRIFQLTGSSVDLKVNFFLMADKIKDLSEVDLTTSQAVSIGRSLVEKVRDRSHRVLPALPQTDEELRTAKGIVIDDVLSVLSLSPSGYRALKAGDAHAVRSLSRLQRLCKRSGVPEHMIADICNFKTKWDGWRLTERHGLNEIDLLALKAECATLLKQHSIGELPIPKLATEAKALAEQYNSILSSTVPLSGELVTGLVFAIAAETGEPT